MDPDAGRDSEIDYSLVAGKLYRGTDHHFCFDSPTWLGMTYDQAARAVTRVPFCFIR